MPRVIEGEVTAREVSAAQPTPMDNAISAFQQEFGAKHGTQLADFFMIHFALLDAFKRISKVAAEPGVPDPVRFAIAMREARSFGPMLTDLVVAGVVLRDAIPLVPSQADVDRVNAILELARAHHESVEDIQRGYDPQGNPREAANDEEDNPRIIVPTN